MATPYSSDKTGRSGSSTRSTMERASEAAGRVAGAVEHGADAVKERTKEAANGALKIADEMGSAVKISLKDQPMATLTIAAALGFVLGAIWKS